MVTHTTFCRIGALCLILLITLSLPNPALCRQSKNIVLTLPAETVLSSVQKMLPLSSYNFV